MRKLDKNKEDILKEFEKLKDNENLAYLFEDNSTVVSGINNYELVKSEIYDSDNVLLDVAVVEVGEEYDFFNGQILSKCDIPSELYNCQHDWINSGSNSSLLYTQCTKCGEVETYELD